MKWFIESGATFPMLRDLSENGSQVPGTSCWKQFAPGLVICLKVYLFIWRWLSPLPKENLPRTGDFVPIVVRNPSLPRPPPQAVSSWIQGSIKHSRPFNHAPQHADPFFALPLEMSFLISFIPLPQGRGSLYLTAWSEWPACEGGFEYLGSLSLSPMLDIRGFAAFLF